VASIPFWTDDPESWDTVVLGGATLPGIAEVHFDKSRDVDKKKSKGNDGITLTDNGADAAEGEITLTIWTAEQWRDWQRIKPKLDPQKAGGIKSPLTIIHPMAASAGVDTVYVEKLSETHPRKGGAQRITMSVVQWFAQPKPVRAKKEPDQEVRRAQAPGNVFLTGGEGLDGLSNPDGSLMDLSGPGGSGLSQEEQDKRDNAGKGPSMFDKFGFGSTDPGTATGE
jgi:hypothetical protein